MEKKYIAYDELKKSLKPIKKNQEPPPEDITAVVTSADTTPADCTVLKTEVISTSGDLNNEVWYNEQSAFGTAPLMPTLFVSTAMFLFFA